MQSGPAFVSLRSVLRFGEAGTAWQAARKFLNFCIASRLV